jgi:hypothetical protein
MQEFFSRLMASHAQAVKALEQVQGAAGPAPFEASTLRIKLDGVRISADVADGVVERAAVSDDVVRQVIAANRADVEHVSVPLQPEAGDEADLNRQIAGWRRGDWFDFSIEGAMERMQLRWVSPRRTLFLFTPAGGAATRSFTPASLRACLRAGQLAAAVATPLFERAVRGVMEQLQNTNGPAGFAHAI